MGRDCTEGHVAEHPSRFQKPISRIHLSRPNPNVDSSADPSPQRRNSCMVMATCYWMVPKEELALVLKLGVLYGIEGCYCSNVLCRRHMVWLDIVLFYEANLWVIQ